MTPQVVDYTAVLADLDRRRNELRKQLHELETLIASMKSVLATQLHPEGASTSLERVRYRNSTIRAAAHDCLKRAGKPMKTKDIADAILAGGLVTKATNLKNAVYATLTREQPGVFVVDNGVWGLAEWSSHGRS
jgi:hypothetical protein